MIKLSKRLMKIADYVEDNSNIVDIGCDHGLLDIYLVRERKNIKVLASDVNQHALDNAIHNIKKNGLEDEIVTVLSNGLEKIDTMNLDTIVISGMGSHTIAGILYSNMKKLKTIQTIIIQSNNDLDFLRYKVTKLGYYVAQEGLVKDKGILYTVIKFKKGYRFYTKKQLYFGPCLLKENSDLFQEKKKLEYDKLKKLYPMIPKSHWHHRWKTLLKMRYYK